MHARQKGFTLIEIAIVLVIIGLLLGGVMKGQELIHSAKVKNLANDFRTTSTLVYAYQDRFRALPGDQSQAQLDGAFGANAATHCTPATDGLCRENNGRIDGDWNATALTAESFTFWQHVRLANLTTGSTNTADANYLPRNAEGGQIGIESGISSAGASAPYIKNMRGAYFICSAGISGRHVRQLDEMLDDGNSAGGSLQAVATGAARNSDAATTTALQDGLTYTVCLGT